MANTKSISLVAASSQYLSAADSASLSVTGDVTVEAWCKFESLPTGATGRCTVVAKGTLIGGDQTSEYSIEWLPAAAAGIDEWRCNFRRASDNNTIEYGHTPTIATWYHVAVTRNTTTGGTLFYLNGALAQTTANSAGALVDNTQPLTIGADANGAGLFDGKIDEVRVWSVERTVAEILANKDTEIDSATGLQASYHLNDSLADATGNGNTLTNNGSATYSTDIPFGGVTSSIKTFNGLAYASTKTVQGLAIASVKNFNGLV